MAAASPSPEAAARVGLLYDERMCAHATPDGEDHPENPERLRAIWRKLNDEGVVSRCVVLKAKEAEDQHIASVHSQNHIKLIKEISSKKYDSRRNKIAKKFNSIYFNKGSSESALLAAGSVVVVAEKVAAGELSSAIALVRPPGHHAEHDKAMGFCLFNNVAIAANYLLNERTDLGIKKILIVDWDIHHGNATQKMFYDDPRVLSFSVHRFDYGTFYPYEADGSHNFIGEEAGRGYNINVPWEHGKCGDADYIAAWDHVLLPVTEAFDPDIILVSAGFDAALGDPLGGCCITPNGYALLLTKLLGFAKGRIVMALEGGYNLRSVASSVFACAKVLLGDKFTFNSPATQSSESTLRVIQAVRNELKTCWPVLSNNLSEIVSMTRPSPSEVHCPTLVGVPLGHTGPLLEETKVRCKRKRDNNTSLPATLKRSPACFNQCNPTDKRRSQRTMKAIHKQMVVDKDYANVSDSDGSHPNISEPEFSIQGEYLHDCSAAEVELDPLEETRETPFETSDPEHSLGAWSPPEDEDVIRTPVHVSRAFESSLQSFSVHDTQSSDLLRKTANSTEGSKAPNIINGSTLSSDFRGNLVPTFSATQRKDLKQHKNLKPQSSPIDNEHILGVEGRLNSLLDVDGGISKRKDAINGYLMLLLTAAAGGGAQDLSLILEALLKTKSHSVLLDIINKNGLQMLHTILKQTRYIFHQTPILRRLLKVLEFLAQKGILTSEHINGGPRCAGVESFRDSMLSLTRHPDIQVHQIARSFRDRWIPHNNARSEPTEYPHTSVNDLPEVAAWLEHEQIRRWTSDGLQKISIALTQHLAQTDESLKRFAREKSELLRKNALGERDQAREEAIKQSEMADALNSRVGELVSELEAERKKNDLLCQLAAVEHQEMLDWRRRCEEAKKVRSEAVENAGILATALQSEEKAHAELRTAVADFSRRFGTEDLESRASARSQLSALGGYIRGELRGAFRSGVKCCMAVVCSHFLMTAETLDNLSDGFFFSSDDEGPGEDAKTAELYALVEEPAGKLAAHFEDEVCPPYSPIESSYEALMEPIEIFEETPTGTPMPGAGVGDETGDSAAPRTTSPDPGVGKADAPTPGAAGP